MTNTEIAIKKHGSVSTPPSVLRVNCRSTTRHAWSPLDGSIDLFQMTELTVVERKRDLAMAGAAILAPPVVDRLI